MPGPGTGPRPGGRETMTYSTDFYRQGVVNTSVDYVYGVA